MASILDFFIFKYLINSFKALRKDLAPSRAYSWKTFIYLSAFSWLMSLLATDLVHDIITHCGWIFLIIGVSWATTENPLKIWGIPIGPWITGALICMFLFGDWTGSIPPMALIVWPTLSSVIAVFPTFFDEKFRLKVPALQFRQRTVILIGSNMVISCWIQFYFMTQDWLEQYPTLLSDHFGKTTMVSQSEFQPTSTLRGTVVLEFMEPLIVQELENKPWSEVERWLLEPQPHIEAIRGEAVKKVPLVEEDFWWRYTYNIGSINSGYNLQLRAVWQGPRSQTEPYYVEKNCQITQSYQPIVTGSRVTPNQGRVENIAVAQVNCQPISELKSYE
jgi:hypothetical protein